MYWLLFGNSLPSLTFSCLFLIGLFWTFLRSFSSCPSSLPLFLFLCILPSKNILANLSLLLTEITEVFWLLLSFDVLRGKCFSATDPATETVRAGRSGDPVNTGVSKHKLNKFQVVRGRECELPEKSRSRQLEESATLGNGENNHAQNAWSSAWRRSVVSAHVSLTFPLGKVFYSSICNLGCEWFQMRKINRLKATENRCRSKIES